MNVNLGPAHIAHEEALKAQIDQHRAVMVVAFPTFRFASSPVLVPDEEHEALGVYQVWWPVVDSATSQATFLHVSPDGVRVEMEAILPDHWFS